jgi:hypothetical protein
MSRPARPCLLALVLSIALFGACRKPEPPPAPAPVRVENRALGLAIAALPDGFRVEANDGTTLRFASDGASGAGTLTVSVGPAGESVNVIEKAKSAQKELEQLPGATFSGGNELVTPAGAGFAVRASWDEGAGRVEERRIFALHPDQSGRLVTLVDRYPAGDATNARDRFGRELALLSALEAH